MRGVGLLAGAIFLGACQPATLAVTPISISLSVVGAPDVHLAARLHPQQVRLHPGEETALQLDVRNTDRASQSLTLAVAVAGPSDGLAVTAPTELTVPRGVTHALIRVVALPGVVPGRYDVEIRIRSP